MSAEDDGVIYEAPDQPARARNPIFEVARIVLDTLNNPLPDETPEQMLLRAICRIAPPKTKA